VETTTRESKPLVELDTIDASGRPPSEPSCDSSELLAIGRYRVLGRIGAGGMGTVWAAHDPMLGREVAIKLARVDGPGSLESRLLREARLLAQVRHPNVVEIHEIGQFRGQIYIVMARIHGQTLRAWQRERPRTWRATVAKYVAAARGLQAAHAAGLVHRDFKAENVLVGDDERVYVVDFGLARPTGVALEGGVEGPSPALSLSSDSPLTRTGAVVGTPAYMAPEQRAGRPPDVRSDIYSFCVSLYEALHGQRPGSKPEATATRRREVPRRIDRALARGLAPAASQRYASVGPLIAALERDPGRWWRRIGLAAVLVVIGGFAGLMASDGGEPRAASCEAAIRRIDRAWGDPQRAALAASFAGPGEYARAAGRRVALALDAYADEWQRCRRARRRSYTRSSIASSRRRRSSDARPRCWRSRAGRTRSRRWGWPRRCRRSPAARRKQRMSQGTCPKSQASATSCGGP
jgi:predicted Ser/Thr protein kinase